MRTLKDLRDTAEEMFDGLTAGEALRKRILAQAAAGKTRRIAPRGRFFPMVPACAAMVLMVGISLLAVGRVGMLKNGQNNPGALDHYAAGAPTEEPTGDLMAYADVPDDSLIIGGGGGADIPPVQEGMPAAPEVPVTIEETAPPVEVTAPPEIASTPEITAPPVETAPPVQSNDAGWSGEGVDPYGVQTQMLPVEMPLETEVIATPKPGPAYHSLFIEGDGANFPLVGFSGKAYQQLYVSAYADQLGDSLGSVGLFTQEPSLADNSAWTSDILSNAAQQGSAVYQIAGISSDTAVAVQMGDGSYALFQRVGYAGRGTLGQSLESTLDIRGQVSSLALSGVGTISDPARANAMVSLLLDNAAFYSDDTLRGRQSLDIYLQSGLTLQMQISDGVFSACGSWTCGEFFDEFARMMD